MAKVSVIIAVYNGAATIGRALASVFAQTFRDFEIVVVNDGSTDDTASVLARHRRSYPRHHPVQSRSLGRAKRRRRASSGEYLAFLDDDDEWMPAKLARCVPILDADPECALVYTLALKVDPQWTADGPQNASEGRPMAVSLPR